MTVAAVLLAIAALGGVVMAAMRFGGRELPPMALAVIHGLFAASGLVALILFVVNSNASTLALVALVGFVIAALGGFTLFVLGALAPYAASLAVRGGAGPPAGKTAVGVLRLEGSGLLLLSVGGWYGGHLVFHHGVGRERRSEG